jgi:Protein of unknown function (DUF3891)
MSFARRPILIAMKDMLRLNSTPSPQMIIQPERPSHDFLAISQPAHSWISGQIARTWGNKVFSGFQPFEQMCYAAGQHDIGFLVWENAPTLNQATGLPHTFDELPEQGHFEIWRNGISQLRPVCLYASLVVSLHFCNLCERFHDGSIDRGQSGPGAFLKEQREYQEVARRLLRGDPLLANAIEDHVLSYHRDLIATWDLFSLQLCRSRSNEFKLPKVPIIEGGRSDIAVRKIDSSNNVWEVDPWPFNVQSLTTISEGKVIRRRFKELNTMRAALQDADRISLQFHFQPRSEATEEPSDGRGIHLW